MVGCQNYGPFWGTLNLRCRILLGIQKGTIINFDKKRSYVFEEELGSSNAVYFGYCPPLSNSWIITLIWLYIALNRTLNIDCYLGGSTQGPKP